MAANESDSPDDTGGRGEVGLSFFQQTGENPDGVFVKIHCAYLEYGGLKGDSGL